MNRAKSARRITLNPAQLLELYNDRSLFSCFIDTIAGSPDEPTLTAIATARGFAKQYNLMFPDTSHEVRIVINPDTGEFEQIGIQKPSHNSVNGSSPGKPDKAASRNAGG